MSTILVTGAAGFIGSFLSEALIENGFKVIGVDNFFRGKLENIQHLSKSSFSFYEMDLSETDSSQRLHELLKQHHVTYVYHLAAINGTKYFYDRPFFVLDQNIKLTQCVLRAIEHTVVKKIIYTSSSEVYNEPLSIPTPETHPILLQSMNDRDSYAASKALGEFYIRLYAEQHHIDYQILRVFNTYGERMVGTSYGQVIPEFIHKLLNETIFTMYGPGTQTRSFCYVKDLCNMILGLLKKNIHSEILNIGNDEEITINELAHYLHTLVHKPFHPQLLPPRDHDPKRRQPDLTHIRQHLPHINFTSLKDGLKHTLDYYIRRP